MKLNKDQKELIELTKNNYYFNKYLSDILDDYFYDIVNLENKMLKDKDSQEFILKNYPSFLMCCENVTNPNIAKKEYYKYNPNLYYDNQNPDFYDLIEVNKAVLLELTYNYFLYIYGVHRLKTDNIKILQKIISHYTRKNKLSDLEKGILLSVNPFLGLLKNFNIKRENIDKFIEDNKKVSFKETINYNILTQTTEKIHDDYGRYLNRKKIKPMLSHFFNHSDLLFTCIFQPLYNELELKENISKLLFSDNIITFFYIDSDHMFKLIPNVILSDSKFIDNLDSATSKLSNKEKEVLYDESLIRFTLFKKQLYLLNISWSSILKHFNFSYNSDIYFEFSDDINDLLNSLIKSNKNKDPLFLSHINSLVKSLNIAKHTKDSFIKRIQKSPYFQDDAKLLLYSIQVEQYNENVKKVKDLIKDNKLKVKDDEFNVFLQNIDLTKDTIKTSDLINTLIKMIS